MEKFEPFFTLLSALFALVFVLVLAYLTIKWMSGRMTGMKGSKVINVIDRVMIGQDKCLLVVRVGEQTMLIGMSGDSVVKLSDLQDLPEITDIKGPEGPPEFSDVLRDAINDGWKKIRKKGEEPR